MKSELAEARDKWLQSEEGETLSTGQTHGQFLRNRIERAFIAGWTACGESTKAEIDRLKEALKNYRSCPQRLGKKT